MINIVKIAITVLWTSLCLPLHASETAGTSFGLRPDGRLDQTAIANAYKESEWESVVSALQNYLSIAREAETPLNDRIFAFKYLGVILSADTATHARAESYFTRLLELSPTVEIVDLIPSNRVADFFDKVKADFQKRKEYTQSFDVYGHATDGDSAQASGVDSPRRPSERNSVEPRSSAVLNEKEGGWVWWTVGLAVAAGAGAGIYYYAIQSPSKKINETEVVPR